MPKIDVGSSPSQLDLAILRPSTSLVKGRFRKRLGDAGGLTQFGVNLCRLEPGSGVRQRHWHHGEDELVYMLEGEAVLIEDEAETVLRRRRRRDLQGRRRERARYRQSLGPRLPVAGDRNAHAE